MIVSVVGLAIFTVAVVVDVVLTALFVVGESVFGSVFIVDVFTYFDVRVDVMGTEPLMKLL